MPINWDAIEMELEAQRKAEIEAAWAEYERLQELAESGNLEQRDES